MTKKPRLKVKVRVSSASCSIFASFEMPCPMCGIDVPARTQHTCGDGSTQAAVVAIVGALAGLCERKEGR